VPGLCCDAAAYPPILATVRRPPTDLSSRRTSLWCINHCCQYFNWRKTAVPERSRARRVDPSAAMMCNVYGILGDAVEAHPGGVLKPRRALVVEFASVRFLSSASEAPSGLCTAGPSLRLCASVRPVEALLSRLGVGSAEAQALFGQSVEVGGPDPAVTVSAEVVPPAAFYEHDVGSVRVSPQARQGRRVSDSDKPFMRHTSTTASDA
jgi:hypothetical protein